MARNPCTRIISRVKGTIERYQMIEPHDHIGVAVSGGADSIVLLDILAGLRDELHISLTILHLNHGIRGKEAARDQQFVGALSREYTLPCFDKVADVPAYKRERSLSPQEAAREVRYLFFEEAIQAHALDKVAMGQTADDQAETVLMRFITGGGTRGLKGIPPLRGPYIRPLIEVWREELLEYAQHKGLSFVQDSSNMKKAYLRNRIRHELLPALREYNPNIKERLLQLARILGEDESYLEALTDEIVKRIVVSGDEETSISIPQLLALPPALQSRVLLHAYTQLTSGGTLEYLHINTILRMIQGEGGSKRLALPKDLWAAQIYDTLVLRKGAEIPEGITEAIELEIPGRTQLDEFGVEIEAVVTDERIAPRPDPQEAYLDYQQLTIPLRVRSVSPGDSFTPLGMDGRKKLKNLFIDLKVPRSERSQIPLVISGDDICWVAGWRIDERFKIRKGTKKVLRLTIKRLKQ
jgi:tRNA(Ile)-lysidine synthase